MASRSRPRAPPEARAAQAVLALAAGALDEAGYARFLRANSQPLPAH